MNKKEKKNKIICSICKSECKLSLEYDGACNDPECCDSSSYWAVISGSRSYWAVINCPKCGEMKKLK